ncbi:MAG: hypothetical protein ACJ73S_19510 [Mycobacteriales bacterium]
MAAEDDGMAIIDRVADDRPTPIRWSYHPSLDSALESVRAADALGLGVKLWNQRRADNADDEVFSEEWVVELLTDVPLGAEDDDEQ